MAKKWLGATALYPPINNHYKTFMLSYNFIITFVYFSLVNVINKYLVKCSISRQCSGLRDLEWSSDLYYLKLY